MKKITREEILSDVAEWLKTANDTRMKEYLKRGFCGELPIRRECGGWKKVLKHFNRPLNTAAIPRETVKADIARVIESKHSTRLDDYLKYGKYSKAAIVTAFGCWNNALTELGFKVNMYKSGQFTKEDIAKDYMRICEEEKHELSCKEYRERGNFSQQVIRKYFGSFTKMKKQIGCFRKFDARFLSDKEVLDDLRAVYEKYGTMSESLISRECLVSAPTLIARFGSLFSAYNLAGIPITPENISYNDSRFAKACREIVKNILGDDYETEKTFPWLRYKKPLRIDMYYDRLKLAIEFDGIQHERYVSVFHRSAESFFEQQEKDRRKSYLLVRHGIKIVRIKENEASPENIEKLLKQYTS